MPSMVSLGQFEANTLICADCFEILAQLPESCIDLIVTDPPWFVSREVTIHRSMNPAKYKYVGKDISLDFGAWDHFESERDYWAFIRRWMAAQARVLKPKGHLVTFFDQHRVSYLIDLARELSFQMRQHLYWVKSNPVPRARKVDFMVALEEALWFTKGSRSGATFNYQLGQQRNYVRAAIPHKNRIHPTQKPIKVLEVWIRYLSSKDDLVADFLCGSGSTLVAAKRCGRKYFGVEKDSDFVKKAKLWLAKTPTPLF